jgi:CheY-like chemotaxis protein
MGATEPPVLLVVGVEEPEKAGFKIFQRLKKGPLSKLPIILATGTVSPDSFAKHKGLKTHAEDYVDKRTISKEELATLIDALIGLGAQGEEDDLDIPVEVDEIHVGDHEGAIDEEAPPDEYADQKTRMGGPDRVDAAVADDVDDAFAGMMGDDDSPSLESMMQQPPQKEPVQRVPTTALLPRITVPPATIPVPQISDDGTRDFDEMPSTRADLAATMDALRHEVTTAPPPIAEEPAEREGLGRRFDSRGDRGRGTTAVRPRRRARFERHDPGR